MSSRTAGKRLPLESFARGLFHHFPGHHPIGEIAVLCVFQRPEHRHVDVAATDHRKAVCGGKIGTRGLFW
jgi:hypothetical protein